METDGKKNGTSAIYAQQKGKAISEKLLLLPGDRAIVREITIATSPDIQQVLIIYFSPNVTLTHVELNATKKRMNFFLNGIVCE